MKAKSWVASACCALALASNILGQSTTPRPIRGGVSPAPRMLVYQQAFPPVTYPSATGENLRPVTIPKFDPSLGQIKKAIFTFFSSSRARGGIENHGLPITTYFSSVAYCYLVRNSDGWSTPPQLYAARLVDPDLVQDVFLASFDGVDDFQGSSGFNASQESAMGVQITVDGNALGSEFIGTGNLDLAVWFGHAATGPWTAWGPYGLNGYLEYPVHAEHLTVAYVYQ